MRALMLVDHSGEVLASSTLSTITAARRLACPIDAVVVGCGCERVADQVAGIAGIETVYVADHDAFAHIIAENFVQVLIHCLEKRDDYTHFFAPATTFGKNITPRLAALCNVMQLSDITQVIDADTFVRPIYAGNVFATVKSRDGLKVITVRPTAFKLAATGEAAEATVTPLSCSFADARVRFVGKSMAPTDRPDLMSARVVVSGGRALKSPENFQRLENIALNMGAAVGATRAAVDAGFVSNDYQVGQTGKVVAPDVYIALGISGAIQHIAGMSESKVIVAVNTDEDARIFEIADIGYVGDLFKVLAALEGG